MILAIRQIFALLKWELLSLRADRNDTFHALFFFVMSMTLLPLTVGDAIDNVIEFETSMSWVLIAYTILFSITHLFSPDFQDGTLEVLSQSSLPLTFAIFLKLFVHWIFKGLALAIVASLYALVGFSLSLSGSLDLFYLLLAATPSLIFIGAMGASLVLSQGDHKTLLFLLTLPLYIPVLIVGAEGIDQVIKGDGASFMFCLKILAGFSLISVPLCTFVSTFAVKEAFKGA